MASKKRAVVGDDSDDDTPLSARSVAPPPPPTNGATKHNPDSDDEVPLAKRVAVKSESSAGKTESKPAVKAEVKPAAVKTETKAKDAKPAAAAEKTADKDVKPSAKPADKDAKPPAKPSATAAKTDNGSSSSSKSDKPKRKAAKDDSDSSDDDADEKRPAKRKAPVKKEAKADPDSSDSDVPLSQRKKDIKGKAPAKVKPEPASSPEKPKPAKRKVDKASSSSSSSSSSESESDSGSGSSSDSDSDDDKPLNKRKPAAASSSSAAKPAKKPTPKKAKSGKDDDSEAPAKKKRGGKKKADDENGDDDDDEEVFKWWEQAQNDGEQKWKTLEHNGVVFPPDYVPHNVPLTYDGKKVKLPPAAEEVASFFAVLAETDWGKNKVFQQNFFRDFREVLKQTEKDGHTSLGIKDFAKCDFSAIALHLAEQREAKKTRSKEEKQREKEEKKRLDDKYGWCVLDGRKEKVGNYRIEPPSLFRGRGAHPKAGTLKTRVRPEQVTINIGEGAKVPSPPPGHSWASVVHNNKATWLATWTENVNGATKYVFLAATSTLKGMSDMKKYNKARELKKHIKKIREEYTKELSDAQTITRQRATAIYLIDKLALRAGNEKDTDEEADTVGCCSLRVEHITLKDDNMVVFDFLGKDSMRYYNEVKVDPLVHRNLHIFKRGKKDDPKKTGDLLFDRINTGLLNKHLNALMPNLSAKVFRTYNASITFQAELQRNTESARTVPELVLAYNRANREAAILCNHQRSVPKALQNTLSRLDDRIKLLKLERRRYRLDLLEQQPGRRKTKGGKAKAGAKAAKKKAPPKKKKSKKGSDDDDDEEDEDDDAADADDDHDVMDSESDFDEQTVKETEKLEAKLEEEKEEKKKKSAEEKGESYTPSSPKKRSRLTVDQLVKKIKDIDERIEKVKVERIDKDENKTTALGTSKINYLDPRITVAWCKKNGKINGIDPKDLFNKVFNKSLQDKFRWAWESTEADFIF